MKRSQIIAGVLKKHGYSKIGRQTWKDTYTTLQFHRYHFGVFAGKKLVADFYLTAVPVAETVPTSLES